MISFSSWLPLLFIPTNASPAFIFLFFICTYFLNRPCVYCSILLLILFITSCNWSDRCFFDFSSNWFQPRPGGTILTSNNNNYYYNSNGTTASGGGAVCSGGGSCSGSHGAMFDSAIVEMVSSTVRTLAGVAAENVASKNAEWTGLGMEWLRSLLGRREWRIDCMDIYIRL
jgi:hypothetical protein